MDTRIQDRTLVASGDREGNHAQDRHEDRREVRREGSGRGLEEGRPAHLPLFPRLPALFALGSAGLISTLRPAGFSDPCPSPLLLSSTTQGRQTGAHIVDDRLEHRVRLGPYLEKPAVLYTRGRRVAEALEDEATLSRGFSLVDELPT